MYFNRMYSFDFSFLFVYIYIQDIYIFFSIYIYIPLRDNILKNIFRGSEGQAGICGGEA